MKDVNDQLLQPLRRRRGVIGILSSGDLKHLVIRRAQNIPKAGYWCFPGGHIEVGEQSKHAIKREFHEELGIEIAPIQRLGSVRVEDSGYVLAVWRVRYVSGDLRPEPSEVAETRWLTLPQIREITPSLTSNLRVLDMLDRQNPPQASRMANQADRT